MVDAPKTIDTAHTDMIHDAKLDYYGKKLATCSSDRTIKIFEVDGDTQTHTADVTGHEGPVWQVEWAHPKFGVLLASCSYDGRVIIHREAEPKVWTTVWTFTGHKASVNSVEWAPHEYGLHLATASSDGTVAVLSHNEDNTWSVQSFEEEGSLGCNAVSWAPFNHLRRADEGAHSMRLVTGSCSHQVKIWRLSEGQGWTCERVLEGHGDWVRDVAWAPSAGIPCNTVASGSEDKTVRIWMQEEAGGDWKETVLPPFSGPVWRVSWSLTGTVLAVSAGDQEVTLWKQNLDGDWHKLTSLEDGVEQ